MFYIRYLIAEVLRRWSKTLTITAGLSIASAIIIVIISISHALSAAQNTVLNPLQNVGTDIMVTRSLESSKISDLDEKTQEEVRSENSTRVDLSKLGNPGEKFSTDSFIAGSTLTFDNSVTGNIDANQVSNYVGGLILSVSHQEGTIPKVSSTFSYGGDKISISQEIASMTDEERAASEQARETARAEIQAKGLDPRSEEARQIERTYMDSAMPERFKRMTTEVITPEKTVTQDVGPIETDIQTSTTTVAGVDTSKTTMGLILPDQIVTGSYFSGNDQIILNQAYADKSQKTVGDTVQLAEKTYNVIGIVNPKLYTNTADLYLPLAELQQLSGREARINILLVKSTGADAVESASTSLEGLFAGAKVVNANDTAKQVSGSLVSAANLTNRFIGLTSIIVIIASCIIVSLLTVAAINKRTREIGTLKAIGWSNTEVVRQIVAENITLGILGAIGGALLGALALYILNTYDIALSANVSSLNAAASNFFRGMPRPGSETTQAAVEATIHLKAAYQSTIFLIGSAVALGGAVISGFFAALKASTLKPQVALRNLE